MRLIDADELKDQIIDEIGIIPTADMKNTVPSAISFVNRLNVAPTIDAVPVVRCRDCVNWDTSWVPIWCDNGTVHFCDRNGLACRGDWFCADGERREDGRKT